MAEFFVHESSYVDDGARVGRGTKIWHFCHVMPGAVIGERCNLGQNVVVMPGTRIGNNVKIQNNVSIYEGVTLEDDVFCGPSCVFTNVLNPRSLVAQYRAIKDEVLPAIQAVIESQQFVMGPAVPRLEAAVARLAGATHGIACASGTDALLLPLKALDLGPGDEVITTPFTFFATA